MKYFVLFLLLLCAPALFAQEPTSTETAALNPQPKATTNRKTSKNPRAASARRATAAKKAFAAPVLSEKEQFEKASAHELAADRVRGLEKFLADFPESEKSLAAAELLTSSRGLIAEEKLLTGDAAGAIALFKLVVEQAPQPISNDLFVESISKIPSTLYFRGHRSEALQIASIIEAKVDSNAKHLLEIATFHIGTENGSDAMRVAAKAAAKDPSSAAVHRTLALAHRINFDLELSADSYAKSLELEPDSATSKRGLAEMKRALGKSNEALTLYRELLAGNENDLPARTGLVLALFDAGKRAEAETELAKALQQTPGNVILLAGAAYWYASQGVADKAVELAEKAVAREPRYVWSHIALARGLMGQNKPVEAEQVLIKARAYGNFPTLEYELASARMSAGFFREAAEDLQKQFVVSPSGNVKASLGGRVPREEKSIADLAAFERKASIFTPISADTTENAEALKALLTLHQKLEAVEPDEADVAAAADAFTAGSDKMKLHRQLHAASLLLQKRVALSKVLELTKAATGNTDKGLTVANPRSAVMASELYEARATAFRRNEFLLVPEVPAQTLSSILRGRIEEIAGWALYQQNNFPDAIIRLRRAISVMPENSAWYRASLWRLGAALAADGKDTEALNSYIESHKTDKPDYAKYSIVEALYKKVNGTTEGLEAKIGRDRVPAVSAAQEVSPPPAPSPSPTVEVTSATPTTTEIPAAANTPTPVVAEPVVDPPVSAPAQAEVTKTTQEPAAEKPSRVLTEIQAKPEPPVNEPPPKTVPADPLPEPPIDEVKPETETKIAQPKTVPADPLPEPVENEPKPETETKIPEPKETPVETRPVPPPADKEPAPPAEKSALDDLPPVERKPLFDPIIIVAGNRSPKQAGDKKSQVTSPVSGDGRARVIDGKKVKLDEVPPCVVGVSQDNVSLINNGGTVGLLVTVNAPGDVKSLTAVSSSPKDLELRLEPEIVGIADKRFYVIKSVSSAVGMYQITFATDCGKKDVVVTVR